MPFDSKGQLAESEIQRGYLNDLVVAPWKASAVVIQTFKDVYARADRLASSLTQMFFGDGKHKNKRVVVRYAGFHYFINHPSDRFHRDDFDFEIFVATNAAYGLVQERKKTGEVSYYNFGRVGTQYRPVIGGLDS